MAFIVNDYALLAHGNNTSERYGFMPDGTVDFYRKSEVHAVGKFLACDERFIYQF
jgi:hypothetical protein